MLNRQVRSPSQRCRGRNEVIVKIKKRNWLIAFSIVFFLFVTMASPVFAEPPPLPSSFYGTVKVNGSNVAVDMKISAWINGVQYAETTVLMYSGDTAYRLDVPGDINDTTEIEGGQPGDTIIFNIGNQMADQNGTWKTGTNVNLDLSHNIAPNPEEKYEIFIPYLIGSS
jgi:hypothetical protein